MRAGAELSHTLARTQIGMLALGLRRPLVNPAAFHLAAGSLWMTTSRYAVKAQLARRATEAAFLVTTGSRSVLFGGTVETYDPRSLAGPVRALLSGPAFGIGLAGYALKNTPFIGGYLLDLAAMPGEWWPQNRVVLRLRISRARTVGTEAPPPAAPAALPGAGALDLGVVPEAYACWTSGGAPSLAPAWWAVTGRSVVAWIPPRGLPGPVEAQSGAVVVEHHHPYRASRMEGVCLHGRLQPVRRAGAAALERRYGARPAGGTLLRMEPERATWWRGFDVRTEAVTPIPRAAEG